MGNSDLIRNLLISAVIFFAVLFLFDKFVPTPQQNPAGNSGTSIVGTGDVPPPPGQEATRRAQDGSPQPPEIAAPATGEFVVIEGDTEARIVTLGNADQPEGADGKPIESPFRMSLDVSNLGASIESAFLSDHIESLKQPDPYKLLALIGEPGQPRGRSFAIEKIIIDGTEVSLHDRKWSIEKRIEGDSEVAVLRIAVHRGDVPAIELERTFTLPQQSVASRRHDLRARLTVTNRSDQRHSVVVIHRGGVGIRRSDNFRESRYVDWGIFRGGGVEGSRESMAGIAGSETHSHMLYSLAGQPAGERLAWAASASKFFTCILAPVDDGGGASSLSAVEAVDLDGQSTTTNDVTVRFVTAAAPLEPGASRTYAVDAYIGAKDATAFKSVEDYAARNYYFQISKDIPFCTFVPLVELMIWLLDALYWFIPNYGVAIIFLVFLVRIMLHPITKKGQVNMVRMQSRMGDLSPKLEEIKKKHANDKTRLQQETMRLYREEGINPAGQLFTCLPMLIQMPIWVALWISLSGNIAMRLKPFVFWIDDLTAPDALYTFSSPIQLPFSIEIPAFNLLPFLLAIAMFFQQKLMPKPKPNPNATEQQVQQQEMMQKMGPLMAVMMLFLFYNAPSGLTLYIMCSTMFGAIEQAFIRKDIKKREEAGTLHKKPAKKNSSDRPPGPMARMLNRLQTAAAEAQKTQKRR